MGVTWGIVAFGQQTGFDRDRVIAEWGPLALACRRAAGFSVLHDDDLITFRRESIPGQRGRYQVTTTVTADPEARARVAGLSCGDGSYDLFERLFDGYEIFVPWRPAKVTLSAPGSAADGLRCESVDTLYGWMWHLRWNPPDDPELARLADELLEAVRVAKALNMMIRIYF